MTDFLNGQFLDNTAQDWIIAAVLVVIVMVVVWTVIGIALRRLSAIASKTETDVDDLVTELLEKTKFLFVALLALYTGSLSLTLTPEVGAVLSTTLVLGLLAQGAFWANGIVNYMLGSWARQKFQADPTISTALGSVGFLIRFAVWSTFVMLALANLDIDIGPLIASLGIGGVALALALQGVLGDLFASLSITFDKPFAVGDSIQVGDLSGTVEHVGLKSTRVRSVTGEQLVFSNGDLLGSRIRNYQRSRGASLRLYARRDLRHAFREARAHSRFDSGDHRVAREYPLRPVLFYGLRGLGAQLRDGVLHPGPRLQDLRRDPPRG